MEYTQADFEAELLKEESLINPPINYKFQRRAMKNYECEKCGEEIHKNELYHEYKPNPKYDPKTHKMVYDKWRKRCIKCEPNNHIELEMIREK